MAMTIEQALAVAEDGQKGESIYLARDRTEALGVLASEVERLRPGGLIAERMSALCELNGCRVELTVHPEDSGHTHDDLRWSVECDGYVHSASTPGAALGRAESAASKYVAERIEALKAQLSKLGALAARMEGKA